MNDLNRASLERAMAAISDEKFRKAFESREQFFKFLIEFLEVAP